MTLGEKIIDEIIKQPIFRMERNGDGCIAIWNGNAAEQLEAVVEEYLRENNHETI